MRMPVALVALTFAMPGWAQSVRVEIYNNTAVDLCVDGASQQDCVSVPPAQIGRVVMRPSHWINFGMESHHYLLPKRLIDAHSRAHSPSIRLQAERDGKLYLLPGNVDFPARSLPPQPRGFPLTPKKVIDLT